MLNNMNELNMRNNLNEVSDLMIRHETPNRITSRKFIQPAPNFRDPQVPVEVIVGKDEHRQSFSVYRNFLTYHSPYFNAALTNGNFKESNGVVELEHASPEVFGLFIDWLYYQTVEDRPCKDMAVLEHWQRELRDKPTNSQLVSLWILADYLQIPKLQNQAMDLLIAKNLRSQILLARLSANNCITSAYNQTLPGSPLRKVFVDIFYWCLRSKKERNRFLSDPDEFPKEFVLDLVYLYASYYAGDEMAVETTSYKNPLKTPSNYHVKEKA